MSVQELRKILHKTLLAIESDQEIDREVVGMGLFSILGRSPSSEEVDASLTQLRMIPSFLKMDERIDRVLR